MAKFCRCGVHFKLSHEPVLHGFRHAGSRLKAFLAMTATRIVIARNEAIQKKSDRA